MPASVVLLFLALRGRRSRPSTPLGPALIVAATALMLRLALGSWGPLHVNGHGARFVAGAARDPADIAAYGPGYSEIFAPIAALVPSSPDWAIFACNALFSALLTPLALAIGRMTGVAASAAFLAAAAAGDRSNRDPHGCDGGLLCRHRLPLHGRERHDAARPA
jgi:hypothetical protein